MKKLAEKLDRQPLPGEIIDGQWIGAPVYYRLTHVDQLQAIKRAAAHMTVDCGHKWTRKAVARLNRVVRSLAREAAKIGGYVSVHMGGLSDRPNAYTIGRGELCATIWITVQSRIVYELGVLCSAGLCTWVNYTGLSYGQSRGWARHWSRVDVTMRALQKSATVRAA